MRENVWAVAGGFHAAEEITGRQVTVYGRTEKEALAELKRARERALALDERVRRGEHLKPKEDA